MDGQNRFDSGVTSYIRINAADDTATHTGSMLSYQGGTQIYNVVGGTTPDGVDFRYTGALAGNFGNGTTNVTKTGAGLMEITGTPSLNGSGAFTLTEGTLRLVGTNAVTNFGGTGVILDAVNPVTLEFDTLYAEDSLTFSKNVTGGASAVARIQKSGPGSVTLTGTGSNFAGAAADAISVTEGKLNVDVSMPVGVSVADEATIGGRGTVGATVLADGAAIQGGRSGTGALTTGDLTMAGAATVSGTLAAGTTPVSAQALTLNGGNGSVQLNMTGSGLVSGTDYDVLSYTSISAPNASSPLAAFSSPSRIFAPVLDTVNKKVKLHYDASAVLTWTGSGSSEWSYRTGLNNWTFSGSPSDFLAGDFVYFGNVANTDVELDVDVAPGNVIFENDASHDYTVTGYGGIAGGTGITKSGAGKVTINTLNTYTGATTITEGTFQLGDAAFNGTLAPTGSIANDGTFVLYNDYGSTIQGTDLPSAPITGGGSLVKAGNGNLTLNAANQYTGGTVVSQGGLQLNNVNAAGTGGAITLGDANTGDEDITLTANSGSGNFTNPITVSANDGLGVVKIAQTSNYSTLSGTLTLNKATSFTGPGDRAAISGKITGNPGVITFAGSRVTMEQTSANVSDFTGDVLITAGTLQMNANSYGLPSTASVTVNSGALFRIIPGDGLSQKIDALNGDGNVNNNAGRFSGDPAWTVTLSVGNSGGSGSFGGGLVNGAVNDLLALAKEGAGTQILSGSNTYTGVTNVNGGVLQIDGAKSGGGAVAVKSAATLAGSGSVNGATTVEAGGFVAPGNDGIGTLTLASATLSGTYQCQLGATEGDSVAVTGLLFANPGAAIVISSLAPPTAAVYVIATYGSLDGTPPAVTGVPAGYDLDLETPGQIRLVSSAGGYNAWVLSFPGLTDATPGGDPDGDGIPNLMEYAIGGDPRVSSTEFLPKQSIAGGNLVLTYKRSDASETDTTQTGQWSTNLTTWTDIAPVMVNENGAAPDDMKISIPLTNAVNGKLFGRLSVRKP